VHRRERAEDLDRSSRDPELLLGLAQGGLGERAILVVL
jgi:hypothetical protein